jgi:hypothetical protein
MSTLWRLYIFRPTGVDQIGADEALSSILATSKAWQVVDWGEPDQIHQYVSIQPSGAGEWSARLPPSLAFLASWLADRDVSSAVANDVALLARRLSEVLSAHTMPSVAIISPSGTTIHLSSGPFPRLWVDGEFNLPLLADDAVLQDLVNLQLLENRAQLRIKFASIDAKRNLVGDSHEEYDGLFEDLPAPWKLLLAEVDVQTSAESSRKGWMLSDSEIRVGAVAHETGVEILIAVGIGVVSAVVSEALIDLTKHLWTKWRFRRKQAREEGAEKAPIYLQIERVDFGPDGQLIGSTLSRIGGSIDDDKLGAFVIAAVNQQPWQIGG